MVTTREFLRNAVYSRATVDRFLDPEARNWAVFDSELGYILKNSVVEDGTDSSRTISNYPLNSHRVLVNYADRLCRINTYGDSFTQCQQVNNGESWQEYLAAHLGEPIRNFGVGGYGVFQAYRRMIREEGSTKSADYLILNIWSDDHYRSIYKWRWLDVGEENWRNVRISTANPATLSFANNPWTHLRLDIESGDFVEKANPYSTPESLYLLCELDHIHDAFKDDFETQAIMAKKLVGDVNVNIITDMAEALGVVPDISSRETIAATASETLRLYALQSTVYVVNRAREFAVREQKKLLLLLSYSSRDVITACKGELRFDQEFVDYLLSDQIEFFDGLNAHIEDYQTFRVTPNQYVDRYFMSHYNPKGNHFFAFAIKDEIVAWLDPKPPTYHREDKGTLEILNSGIKNQAVLSKL